METNCLSRSKKLPPPPLCLPATNPIVDEEKSSKSQLQRERKRSTNTCCLSSTTDECSHQTIPYILPTSQRTQILETLLANSSVLLTAPPTDGKYRRSSNGTSTYLTLLKDRELAKHSITDSDWMDFMRLAVHKSFEDDLKFLLDKYKTTYFDRVNSPNTTDDTIRSSLCHMVTEALSTYTSTPTTNSSSPISLTNNITNGSSKRKRKTPSNSLSLSAPMPITSETKFVISYLIPGKYENNSNETKTTIQQKQFQKKFSHLFKYIPENDDVYEYLKNNAQLFNNNNNNICLMLYDEVITHMDEYDLQISGISADDCFTLPNSIVVQIDGFSQ